MGGGAVGCSLGKIGIQWLSVGKRWMQMVPLGCIVDKSGVQQVSVDCALGKRVHQRDGMWATVLHRHEGCTVSDSSR